MPKKAGLTTLRVNPNGEELIFSREKFNARIEVMIQDEKYTSFKMKKDIYEKIYVEVKTKYPDKRYSFDAVANYAKAGGNGPSKETFEVILCVLDCKAEDLLKVREVEKMDILLEECVVESSEDCFEEIQSFSREKFVEQVKQIPKWKSFMDTYLRYSNFTFRSKDIEAVLLGTITGDDEVNEQLDIVLEDMWNALLVNKEIELNLVEAKVSLNQYSRKRELLNQIKFYGFDIDFIYKWLVYVKKIKLTKIEYLKIIAPFYIGNDIILEVIENFVANLSYARTEYILPLHYSEDEYVGTSLTEARRYLERALAMDLTFPNHFITKYFRVSRISSEPFEIDKSMIRYTKLCDLYDIKQGLDLAKNFPSRYPAIIFYSDDFLGNDYLKWHIEKYAAENNITIIYCNKVM